MHSKTEQQSCFLACQLGTVFNVEFSDFRVSKKILCGHSVIVKVKLAVVVSHLLSLNCGLQGAF